MDHARITATLFVLLAATFCRAVSGSATNEPGGGAKPIPPSPSLEWSSADGKNKLRLGFVAQAQFESLDDTQGGDAQQNVFLRRARLILSYAFADKLTLFVDTDSANLGKGDGAGGKTDVDVALSDAVTSYKFSDALQVDGGLFLIATGYNHNQPAATLMAMDYSPVTFVESVPLKARVGRDFGFQARGYLAGDHFEYRVAILQGVRGRRPTPSAGFQENDLRLTGRAMYWFAGTQKGLFYRGTSLGKQRSGGVGISFDTQEDYENLGADFYWDQPLSGGNGFTVQVNINDLDGGGFVALPEQQTAMIEAGFFHAGTRLLPYLQYSRQDLKQAGDVTWTEMGLGRYFRGHNANLKIAWSRIERDGSPDRDQIRLQWQTFFF